MRAGTYNIVVDQGTDWAETWTLKNGDGTAVDLTGYTARMHVRRDYDATATLVVLTTENGRISLGGDEGTINVSLAAATTAGITKSGVYDLEIISAGGLVYRPLRGEFTLRREVTR